MANEAILIQRLETNDLFTVTVSDSTGLEKGTILKWSADPNTAAASSADGDIFAGILAEEKVADDGQTEVAVWRKGVFAIKAAAGGATTLGHKVNITGANLFGPANVTTAADFAEHFGTALETTANDEVVQVLVGY
jgi:hypothetical protein